MKNQESKKLVKRLTEKLKQVKNEDIVLSRNAAVRTIEINEKYVTKNDYKQLVALYNQLKEDAILDVAKYEYMIKTNASKFPFLFKCSQSIYDFVRELRFGGPFYIAKEMCRQGKEIDYINEHFQKTRPSFM